MNTATAFLIIVPIVMLIVTFLPPYSRAFGFDQVAEAEAVPQPLPQLAFMAEEVTANLVAPEQHRAPAVLLAEIPSIDAERHTQQLPPPQPTDSDAAAGMAYRDATDVEENELVDVPEDWQPGGKHARNGLIRYVDFSEQDRYSIGDEFDSEKSSFESSFEDPEVLDVVRGFWRAHEELEASV